MGEENEECLEALVGNMEKKFKNWIPVSHLFKKIEAKLWLSYKFTVYVGHLCLYYRLESPAAQRWLCMLIRWGPSSVEVVMKPFSLNESSITLLCGALGGGLKVTICIERL